MAGYPGVPQRDQEADQGGEARLRQAQGRSRIAGQDIGRHDDRHVPADLEGVRLRPPGQRGEQGRPGLHPGRRGARRVHRRRGPGQELPGGAKGPGQKHRGAGRPGHRAGPRACSSGITIRRRTARVTSRSTGPPSPTRFMSETRGPRGPGRATRSAVEIARYPTPVSRGRRRGDHRSLRPTGRAQGRDGRHHPGAGHPRRLRRRHARRGPPPGQGVRRGRRRGAAGPPRTAHRHHRPGDGPRLRRRHHPGSRDEKRVLDPGRPHRRRLALRPPRLAPRC